MMNIIKKKNIKELSIKESLLFGSNNVFITYMLGLFYLTLFLTLLSSSVFALQINVTSAHDSFVNNAMPNTNYGNNQELTLRNNILYPERVLIRFDLPTKPSGFAIKNATLRLYVTKSPWFTTRKYEVHRIVEPWDEYNVDWYHQPSFLAQKTSTFNVSKNNHYSWISVDVSDDVKSFYSGVENHGWLIMDSSENSLLTQEVRFASHENPNVETRPVLILNFDVDNDDDGYLASEDCDDNDPNVYPNAVELCNGVDDDCDGSVDEDFPNLGQNCFVGVGYCARAGTYVCSADHLTTVCDAVPGEPRNESCNGVDDDCDGVVDEENSDGCVVYYYDNDNDGFGLSYDFKCLCSPSGNYRALEGNDCDDNDPSINPNATEVCDNGIDEDCNGIDDPCDGASCLGVVLPSSVKANTTTEVTVMIKNTGVDTWAISDYVLKDSGSVDYKVDNVSLSRNVSSGDSYSFVFSITAPEEPSYYPFRWRMFKINPGVFFGQECSGVLNVTPNCVDADADGFYAISPSCPEGNDCDDSNPSINPGVEEFCYDGIDNNCDGFVDSNDSLCYSAACDSIEVPDEVPYNQTTLVRITMRNTGVDVWSRDMNYSLGAFGPDNTTWGVSRVSIIPGVSVAPGIPYTFEFNIKPNKVGLFNFTWRMVRNYSGFDIWFGELCSKEVEVVDQCVDNDGDGFYAITPECSVGSDCNDNDPSINPNATEVCDNIDNNCDGSVDETCELRDSTCLAVNIPDSIPAGETRTISITLKNTGQLDWNSTDKFRLGSQDPRDNHNWEVSRVNIEDGVVVPTGSSYTFTFDITAPSSPGVYNCSWKMLQELVTWFGEKCSKEVNVTPNCVDEDGDGYYKVTTECPGSVPNGGDCNDSDPSIHPNAEEFCNGVDDDCNGVVDDENATGCTQYFIDLDNDGFGSAESKCLCSPQSPYNVTIDSDCDDNNVSINPNATELCNGVDDDCDGDIDEENAVGCEIYLADFDSDGFGNASDYKCLCSAIDYYTVLNDSVTDFDCNDFNSSINPNATEVCNGVDDDCDGTINEGCGDNAECLSTTIPDSIFVNDTKEVSVTLLNTGETTWTKSDDYKLGSRDPTDNTIWGLSRVLLPDGVSVGPGEEYTFVFDITAPNTTGIYNCSWRMLKEGVAWFGDKCSKEVAVVLEPDVNISVSPVAPDGNNGWYMTRPRINLTPITPDTDAYYHWNFGTTRKFTSEITGYEGTNTLYYYGRDIYGNTGEVHNITFKVDTEAPFIKAIRPFDGTVTNNKRPEIAAYYSEKGYSGLDLSNSELRINNNSVPAVFTNSRVTYIPDFDLDEGVNTIRLDLRDNAGNTGTKIWRVIVDTTPPVINITSPVDGNTYNSRTVLVNVQLNEQASRIEKSINGGRFTQLCRYCNSYIGYMGFGYGENTLAIKATDMVGNSDVTVVTFNVTQ